MLSVNDILSSPRSFVVADDDDIASGPARVFGIYCTSGSDDASVTINNATTAAGGGTTIVLKTEFTTKPSDFISFGEAGIRFDTALSVASSGTGVTFVVTYLAE